MHLIKLGDSGDDCVAFVEQGSSSSISAGIFCFLLVYNAVAVVVGDVGHDAGEEHSADV